MEEFLLRLIQGTDKIPKSQSVIYKRLLALDSIQISHKSHKQFFQLKKSFVIGYIDKNANKTNEIYFLKTLYPSIKDPKIITKGGILHGILHNDLVIAKLISNSRIHRQKVRVLEVLKRDSPKIIGILKAHKMAYKVFNLKTHEIIPLQVSQKSLKNLPPNCIFEIDNGEIINVLGVLDDPKIDMQITLKSHNISYHFSDEILEYCKAFEGEIEAESYPHRVDLSGLPFVTIDPNDAKDFDDAIYFDEKYLYVAIADVSYYVTPNTALDKEALKRSFSIYFPNTSIPMLPPILSQNLCSLVANKMRLAFVWKIRLDKRNGKMLESSLFEAIIKVKQNLNYDEVDKILCDKNTHAKSHFKEKLGQNIEKDFIKSLQNLYKLTSRFRKNRLKNSFNFTNKELKLTLDSNDEIKHYAYKNELNSHKLIEDCMLLANQETAKLMQAHLGGIYRVHSKMSEENIKILFATFGLKYKRNMPLYDNIINLQDSLKEIWAKQMGVDFAIAQKCSEIADKIIISFMPKAQYSSHNIGHFALGFEAYSHFTSPIRRYSDLFAHRILKSLNDKKALRYLLDNIERICGKVNTMEKEIAKVEFEFNDRKFARYFSKKIGEIVECIVVDTKRGGFKNRCIAKMLENGARVFLDKDYEKFTILKVKILSSDIEGLEIRGIVCDDNP